VLVLAVVLLTAQPWRSKLPLVLVPVEFHVSPPGATVRIDGKAQETSQPVFLAVGHHQVEASLDGYESGSTTIRITPVWIPTVELTLRPVAQGFRVTNLDLEDAEVFLDERSLGAFKGTFSRATLTPRQHNIRIRFLRAQKQQASFSFDYKPGRAPKVQLPLVARQSQLLVISSQGHIGFIAGTMSPVSVKLDGNALGTLTYRGLECTNLQPGIHQLMLGDGPGARTISFESGSSPLLSAVIYSDRNEGSQTSTQSLAATGPGRESSGR
jgi:hypothetical protein